jgi:hypothetical protein
MATDAGEHRSVGASVQRVAEGAQIVETEA